MNALPKLAIPGPAPKSPEWSAMRLFDPTRKERPVVIGASEAAAACDCSPYSSALQLYLEKRGEMPGYRPDADNEEQLGWGLRLEGAILDEYASREKCHVERGLPMFFHQDHAFMAATPDGLAVNPASEWWGVEAKNSGIRMFDATGEDENKYGSAGTDQVPVYQLFQAQQQMAVLGVTRVDFPVLVDGKKLQIFRVTRNDDIIAQIVSAEKELSERIVNGDPPPPNWTHEGTKKCLEGLFGLKLGSVVDLDEETQRIWNDYQADQAVAKEIESRNKERRNRILWAMRGAEIGRLPSGSHQLKRSVVATSYVTEADVQALREKVGQVKRQGHERLLQSLVK